MITIDYYVYDNVLYKYNANKDSYDECRKLTDEEVKQLLNNTLDLDQFEKGDQSMTSVFEKMEREAKKELEAAKKKANIFKEMHEFYFEDELKMMSPEELEFTIDHWNLWDRGVGLSWYYKFNDMVGYDIGPDKAMELTTWMMENL